MNISKNIPINASRVLEEIQQRQGAPWNDGRINDYSDFPHLVQLYRIIKSGIPEEDFFYKGDLFRIHTAYVGLAKDIDPDKERIISKVRSDGSCSILPLTDFSEELVAFNKSPDFTNFNKVIPDEKAVLIHVNTKSYYGIDVNKLQKRFGIQTHFYGEQEVLFPLLREFVVKEYLTTPNKAKYYLRKYLG